MDRCKEVRPHAYVHLLALTGNSNDVKLQTEALTYLVESVSRVNCMAAGPLTT